MDADAPPIVAVPEPLDRTVRLGPFASGRDALKFLGYAAIGALLVPLVGPWIWPPFLLAAGAIALWRPDGQPLDDRLVRLALWHLRRLGPRFRVSATGGPVPARGPILRLGASCTAILRTGGVPLAYLPPAELTRRFEQFRDLLGGSGDGLVLFATRATIHPSPYLPAEPAPVEEEGAARAGYRELVEVIVRRRRLRHVYVGLSSADPDAVTRLETRVQEVTDRLVGLGVRPTRLRGRAMEEAARRMGLAPGGPFG